MASNSFAGAAIDEVSLPPSVDGWVSIGRRLEEDGYGKYLAVHVQRKFKPEVIEYLLGHLERAVTVLPL
jgi:hypothetical protein